MTVFITDEQGSPLNTGIDSLLVLPDGNIDDFLWTSVTTGIYTTSYVPDQEGQYSITVEAIGDTLCYLEDITATFTVKACEEAIINLEIGPAVVNELVTFILTVTDRNGNYLSDARIDSEVYLPDCSSITLSWSEKDGIYYTEYTPAEIGVYEVRGTVTVLGEPCFRGFFYKLFTVYEKKLPDLEILNEYIEVDPEPEVGESVTIVVTVRNTGKADAGEFWVMVIVANDELERVFIKSEKVEKLAAGESTTIKFQWEVKHSGKYYIYAIADVGLQEREGII